MLNERDKKKKEKFPKIENVDSLDFLSLRESEPFHFFRYRSHYIIVQPSLTSLSTRSNESFIFLTRGGDMKKKGKGKKLIQSLI